MQILASKQTNDEIKTKGYTFSPAADIDVGEPCFYFNAELKMSFLIFLSFKNIPSSCLIISNFILYAFAQVWTFAKVYKIYKESLSFEDNIVWCVKNWTRFFTSWSSPVIFFQITSSWYALNSWKLACFIKWTILF